MKKFFAAVVCCALIIANASAQQGTSVVEATGKVALASAQEPAAPVAPAAQTSPADVAAPAQAPVAPIQVEGVPIEANQAAPVYGNSGCGCGGGVVSFAAPMTAAPMAGNCCQPAPSCCPMADCSQNRGFHFSRPYVIRNLGGRLTSIGGGRNNCCN